MPSGEEHPARWVKVLDQTRCIGCHACTTACKSENDVPLGVTRTYVKSVDVGVFPETRRAFQVTRCNQCIAACPSDAILLGDLNVPRSKLARMVPREPVTVRRPEEETRPGGFYKGADQATPDPLAARDPATCSPGRPRAAAMRSTFPPGIPAGATPRRRRAVLLRRAAPCSVAVAGQPLHMDEGNRRSGRRALDRRRGHAVGTRLGCSLTSTPTSRPANPCRSPEESAAWPMM